MTVEILLIQGAIDMKILAGELCQWNPLNFYYMINEHTTCLSLSKPQDLMVMARIKRI